MGGHFGIVLKKDDILKMSVVPFCIIIFDLFVFTFLNMSSSLLFYKGYLYKNPHSIH